VNKFAIKFYDAATIPGTTVVEQATPQKHTSFVWLHQQFGPIFCHGVPLGAQRHTTTILTNVLRTCTIFIDCVSYIYSCTHIDRPDSIFRHSPTPFTFGAKQITPPRLLYYILPHLYQSARATIMIMPLITCNCRRPVSWLPMEKPYRPARNHPL
jgi:hypothetical protein